MRWEPYFPHTHSKCDWTVYKVIKKAATTPPPLISRSTPTFQVYTLFLVKNFVTPKWLNFWKVLLPPFKACVRYYQFLIFHQMTVLQKLWEMFLFHLKSSFHSRDIQIFVFAFFPLFVMLHKLATYHKLFKKISFMFHASA